MELNITKFVHDAAPMDYSASVAEIGNNAGADTWRAACDDSAEWNFLDSEDKREEFREWVKSSGGWTRDEISAWSDSELNALCIQWISGDMRECGISPDCDWVEIEARQSECQIPSNIFRGDDGQIYFYVGS